MKILIVNMTPFFHNTSANIRMCGVISGLAKCGHTVDVLTMKANDNDYAYDSSKLFFLEKYINNYYTFEKVGLYQGLKETNGKKNKSVMTRLKEIAKKIYRFFEIYDSQLINVKNVFSVNIDYDSYDRIISISDPKSSNKIVYELIKKGKIRNPKNKWVQYWGDPWLIDITKNYGWKSFFVKREESKLMSKAYRIVYASPFTMYEQKKIYTKYSSKMFCVNQSMKNKEDLFTETEFTKYKPRNNDGYVLGYIGGYNASIRNIKPLYECCKEHVVNLDIIGSGDDTVVSCSSVRVIPNVSQAEAEAIEQNVNIIVCLCNNRGTQIPGKIFYVASLDKPIIVIADGERKHDISKYLESFNRFIICDNDKEEIYKAIRCAEKEISESKVYNIEQCFIDKNCAEKLI